MGDAAEVGNFCRNGRGTETAIVPLTRWETWGWVILYFRVPPEAE
jgi:hypothetical protein